MIAKTTLQATSPMPEKETEEISLRKETIEIDCSGSENNRVTDSAKKDFSQEKSQENTQTRDVKNATGIRGTRKRRGGQIIAGAFKR